MLSGVAARRLRIAMAQSYTIERRGLSWNRLSVLTPKVSL